ALSQRIVGDCRVRPDSFDQSIFGDELAVMFHQVRQNLERFRPQRDVLAVLTPQEPSIEVQRKAGERISAVGRLLPRWVKVAQSGNLHWGERRLYPKHEFHRNITI